MVGRTNIFIAVLFLLGFTLFTPWGVLAQGAGAKIIPATIEDAVDPGTIMNEEVVITNLNEEEKEFYLYVRNIKGVEAGGVPLFAEEGEVTGYDMSDWVSFPEGKVLIPPNGEVRVPITITVPENASPGSHFGGIFVSVEAPRVREMGAGVGYEVASIISIRIQGDVIDDARIRSFSTDKLFYGSKNVQFEAKIENQGNILIRPYGPLTIQSMFGGKPVTLTVNENLAGVFPRTIRDFTFEWNEDGIGFGRYEAVLALVYDGEGGQKTIDASLVFWVFPSKVVMGTMVGILILFGVGFFGARMYVRRMVAVAEAGRGRRISPQRYRRQVGASRFTFVFTALLAVFALFLIVLFIFFV